MLRIHKALVHRKYRLIFSSASRPRKPGPKGPSAELIAAIVALKQLNPMFGCVKIAQQISHAFGLNIDKDVVRRVLVKNYRPTGSDGPSWLTFLAQAKDSLWSVDFFQCESINLCTFCVMVVIDVFSRRIIGFGIERYPIDGAAVCRIFNHAVSGKQRPQYLSTDRDPLFRFHRWLANLRIHEIEEIKAVPFMPTSHPELDGKNWTVFGG